MDFNEAILHCVQGNDPNEIVDALVEQMAVGRWYKQLSHKQRARFEKAPKFLKGIMRRHYQKKFEDD